MNTRTLTPLTVLAAIAIASPRAEALDTAGWFYGPSAFYSTYFDAVKGPYWAATTTWPANNFFFGTPPAVASGFGKNVNVMPIAAEAGYWATYLLNVDGYVLGCGGDWNNQLGGSYPNGTATAKILGLASTNQPLTDVIQIASSGPMAGRQTYALTARGRVFRWGWDGNTTFPITEVLSQSGPFDKVKQIACDSANVFMLRSDGEVWVFGKPGYSGYEIGTASPSFPARLLDSANNPVKNIKAIAAGATHLVLLDASGRVFGLGRNDSGQFGGPSVLGGPYQQKTPMPILAASSQQLDRIKAIACTQTASFFLRSDGTVWSVGEGFAGLQGVAPASLVDTSANNTKYRKTAAGVPGLVNIKSIWGSTHAMYALDAGGNTFAWGEGAHGERGMVGSGTIAPNLVDLTGYTNYKGTGVLTGSGNMLIKSNGNAYKWGSNPPTGVATPATLSAPAILIWGQPKPHTYVPDAYMTSATTHDGKLMTAGSALSTYGYYHLGQGIISAGAKPFGSTSIGSVVDVDSQFGTSIVLLANGQVVGFGANPLGSKPVVTAPSPISVPLDPAMSSIGVIDVDIAMGRMYHAHDVTLLALTSDGGVWTMGSDTAGLRGDGAAVAPTSQWTRVKDGNGNNIGNVIAIDGGHALSLALCADGTVWAWGTNWYGEIGNGQAPPQPFPGYSWAEKALVTGVKSVAVGAMMPGTWMNSSGFSLYLKDNGEVFSCGSNRHMALGWGNPAGDMSPHPTPTKVQGITQPIKQIRAGWSTSAALTSQGRILMWGQNLSGQLGNGSTSAGSIYPLSPSTNELFWKICMGSVSQTVIGITAK
jgi:alpha-tubulin suppressor-like RCC1 family protein